MAYYKDPQAYMHDDARAIYQFARQHTDLMVKAGKILPGDFDKEFARYVCRELKKRGMKVPAKMLEQAGL